MLTVEGTVILDANLEVNTLDNAEVFHRCYKQVLGRGALLAPAWIWAF